MTESRYLFVSTFSSLYLLHYSCLSILQQPPNKGVKHFTPYTKGFSWSTEIVFGLTKILHRPKHPKTSKKKKRLNAWNDAHVKGKKCNAVLERQLKKLS